MTTETQMREFQRGLQAEYENLKQKNVDPTEKGSAIHLGKVALNILAAATVKKALKNEANNQNKKWDNQSMKLGKYEEAFQKTQNDYSKNKAFNDVIENMSAEELFKLATKAKKGQEPDGMAFYGKVMNDSVKNLNQLIKNNDIKRKEKLKQNKKIVEGVDNQNQIIEGRTSSRTSSLGS